MKSRMNFLRSYTGLITISWIFAFAVAPTARDVVDVVLSDNALNALMRPTYGVIIVAAGILLVLLLVYLATKMKRRAENKVRHSDPILLTDIQTLAQSNSPLLDDAIALRCAQTEQGRSPGD